MSCREHTHIFRHYRNLVHPALTEHFGRPEGERVPFLSANTLHMLDQALWHLPFATRTDLETAAKKGDHSIEKRTGFLNVLLSEHSCPAAQEQLKNLWNKWLEKNYPDADDVEDEIFEGRCVTPTDEDHQTAIELLAAETAAGAAGAAGDGGSGGSGGSCGRCGSSFSGGGERSAH